MTGHVEDYSILVYTNQQIYSGLQVLMLAHIMYLAMVTVHQKVGNSTYVITPLDCKNVHYFLATK